MGRYRKILVAIDGSESSRHALKESFRFAVDEKCWITVVSVVPPYEGELELIGIRSLDAVLRQPCEKALADAAALAKAAGALIKTVCEEGEPYERIVDLADAESCDLVVMGRKGVSRLERPLVGSVTARVIGHSRMDVLVVPDKAEIGWKRIIVATDGSRYSKAAAEKAIDFAKSYGGEIKAVSVVDVPPEFYAEAPDAVEDMVEKMKGFVGDIKALAESSGVKAEGFVGEGDAYRVITDLAEKEEADVIIVGSHGRTGMKRLLMGSVAEKIIGYAPCPVLVARL